MEGLRHLGGPSSSGDGVAGGLVVAPRVADPADARHATREEASGLLPITKGASISLVKNRQWQIRYRMRPIIPRSHTVTFSTVEGPLGLAEHLEGLFECLMWIWNCHEEVTGEICPHDLRLRLGLPSDA